MRIFLANSMREKLKSSKLQEFLIPDYAIGCRRPTPGVGYLEALMAENINTVFGDIREISNRGVVDSEGGEHQMDVLVCATGFDTSYKPCFPLLGTGGRNLQDEWAIDTKAYLATAISGFPNYLMFFGPNNPFGSGSYMSAIGML